MFKKISGDSFIRPALIKPLEELLDFSLNDKTVLFLSNLIVPYLEQSFK